MIVDRKLANGTWYHPSILFISFLCLIPLQSWQHLKNFRAPSFSENLDLCLAIEEQTMQQACQQTAQAASEWMPFVEDPTEPLPGHPFDLLPCNKSTRLHNASLGGNLKEHPFGFLWNVGGKEYGSGNQKEIIWIRWSRSSLLRYQI